MNKKLRNGLITAMIVAMGAGMIAPSLTVIAATTITTTGWFKTGEIWNYLNDGVKAEGWVKDGTVWYFLDSSGTMKTGWVLLGETWYFLNENGEMKTGWIKDGATWYFLNSSGEMKTGWIKSGTVWYFLNSGGAMAVSTITPDGYILDANGAWLEAYSVFNLKDNESIAVVGKEPIVKKPPQSSSESSGGSGGSGNSGQSGGSDVQAVAYQALKAGVEAKVIVYETLASGILKTKAEIDAAKVAKINIINIGLLQSDIDIFKIRIDAQDAKVMVAQSLIDAEEGRLAEEARIAEAARVAEEAGIAEAVRLAEAVKLEAAKLAAVARVIAVKNVEAVAVIEGQVLTNSMLTGTFVNNVNALVEGTLAWDTPKTVVNATGQFAWTFIPINTTIYNVVKGIVIVRAIPAVASAAIDLSVTVGSSITTMLVKLNGVLLATPIPSDFTVYQSIDGIKPSVKVIPTAVSIMGSSIILAVPTVPEQLHKQKVVYEVWYKDTQAVQSNITAIVTSNLVIKITMDPTTAVTGVAKGNVNLTHYLIVTYIDLKGATKTINVLVEWDRKSSNYVDNVAGTYTFKGVVILPKILTNDINVSLVVTQIIVVS